MADGRRIAVVCALGTAQTLAWGSSYYIPAILAVPMARDLGVSTAGVFAAFSAALVLSALLGPWAGRRIDRFGGRAMLVASNLVFAAGLTTLALAPGPALLALGWLIMGAGMAMGLYEAAFASLVGLYGRAARGPITGITLIAGLASTLCWPVTALLDAELGWRAACLFWAGAHVVIGIPLNVLASPRGAVGRQGDAAPAADDPPAQTPAPQPARLAMALMATAFAATWFVSTAMAAHLPRLLQEAGATPAAALAAAALVGPAQVAGRLLEFGVLRRAHPLLSARLASLGHPLGAAFVLLLGAPLAVFFTVAHGLGNGILTIAKGALPLAVFGAQGYGARLGLLMAPARVAQAAAPLGFALAVEAWGAGALWVSAAISLLGLAALMALRAGVEGR